jgi:ribonucleoside-diphosphate reductase alpha chain
MGFADMLFQLGIPYDSSKARSYAISLMKLFLKRCRQASMALAKQRGAFPNYKGSALEKLKIPPLRNATLTTIAPTGTISLIANTTSGIEPAFALSFYRRALEGEEFLEVLPAFREVLGEEGLLSAELFEQIAATGSIQGMKEIPKKLQEIFKTALEIRPQDHVKMQAVFQKYTDNAVSKTVNLGEGATWEDVAKIYMLAYEMKCKGITVYRYGCHPDQVLTIEPLTKKKKARAVLTAETDACVF